MNTWNSEYVRAGFSNQSKGFITNIAGEIELQHPMVAGVYREALKQNDSEDSQDSASLLQEARQFYQQNKSAIKFPYNEPTLGYVVKWLSELGKTTELDGILAYADKNLKPTWENGGLYYPRNDVATDEAGRWTHMDPFSGNTAIGYARLNVENGQKKIMECPWSRDTLAGRPFVDGLDLSLGVDCLRGVWDQDRNAMVITLREWAGAGATVSFDVKQLSSGPWVICTSRGSRKVHNMSFGEDLSAEVSLQGGEEVDIVIAQDL